MKDALGHGSFGGRGMLPTSKIGIAANARFSLPPRPMPKQTTQDHVADLRNRLSAPKPGLVHAFMTGVKNAMGYST